jgi:hypothetical protein
MVQFGSNPSTGTLFRASQFLSEELPIRLAHRVQELGDLPDGLNDMPSIQRVRDWYAQSFEVSIGTVLLKMVAIDGFDAGNYHLTETNFDNRSAGAPYEACQR